MDEPMSRLGLREATFQGVRWVALTRGTAELIAFASGVVLAHLVPPSEFGRLAVAIIVTELALSLAAESVGAPLVQFKTLRREHVASAAVFGLSLGTVLAAFTWLVVAPFVAAPLFGEETADLFRLFSPVFLLAGMRVVPQAMLQRRLDFRRISVAEIAGVLTGAAVAVGSAATFGLDAEAYVAGILTNAVVATTLLLRFAGVTVPRLHPRELREIVGFGLPAGIAGLAWVGYRNADYAVLGVRLSTAQVGFYYRAYTLGVESEQRISGIIARVIFPVYSRTEDLAHMRALRARIMRVNATVIFPLLALFVAVAPALVPWMFGERWEPAVLPAQILAVAGMAQMINHQTGPLVIAAGRPRVLTVYNLVQLVAYVGVVAAAAPFGLTAVCVAVAGFQLATLTIAYTVVLRRIAGLPLGQLVRDLGPAAVSSALMLAAALPLASALHGASVAAPITVCVTGIVAATLYGVTLRRLFPAAFADCALLVRRVLRPSDDAREEPAAGRIVDASAPAG